MRLRMVAVLLELILCAFAAARAQQWERLGPEGGMVVSLGIMADGEVYLGTADGHVFASKDGAKSWELRGRVGSRLDAVVTRIVGDSHDGKRIFVGVWYQEPGRGGGVFQSDDGGRSWRLLGLQREAVRALEIAPSDSNDLVAGTRSGLFLSRDAGQTWSRISPEGDEEIKNLDSVAIDPRDPQVIYAGTYHLPWLTRDGGKNWKPVIAGIIDDSDIMSLRLDAVSPDRVYMSACSGIYRSENQGAQWIKLQGIPYAARRTQVIAQDPANPKTLYAGTTEGLWVTHDGGESWTRTTSKDWVVNSLVVLGSKDGTPGRVVLGTEGQGIQVSDDGGTNFSAANRGFTHVMVKRLVSDWRDARRLLMVVQRSSAEVLESRDDGRSWSEIPIRTQDHGKLVALDGNRMRDVFSTPWGWLVRTADGKLWLWEEEKQSWREWKLSLPATSEGIVKGNRKQTERQLTATVAIAFLPNAAVVSTNEGLMRCGESGICARLKAFPRSPARAVSVSASGRHVYAVVDGRFGWSTDGGETASWRDLPVGAEEVVWLDLPQTAPRDIFYLGTSRGVFTSGSEADSGWQRIEGGLPAGRMDQYLIGSDLWGISEWSGGFYVSTDKGMSWRRMDKDAERGRFTGLVELQDGAFLAGSQSEGLLSVEMDRKAEK